MGWLHSLAQALGGGTTEVLAPSEQGHLVARHGWDGEKFPGGIDDDGLGGFDLDMSYELLRERSEKLFTENIFAKGLLRRLVTNEIHTGLMVEATPVESVIGVPPESLLDWADDVELRFSLWGENPLVCDQAGRLTWGEIQALIRLEALVGGDCLVVMRQNKETKLPMLEVVKASSIDGHSTDEDLLEGHKVEYGIEVNRAGKHVAFHVIRNDPAPDESRTMRIPAFDDNGRRNAWMVYGSDMRANTLRGEPMLGVVLQSLKELDRYRDAVLRKAVVNSVFAMFVRKTNDGPGSLPISNAAVKRGLEDPWVQSEPGQEAREFRVAKQYPGVVVEELAKGEEIVGMDNRGLDTAYPVFQDAIIAAFAWLNQIPPEILTLSFNSNYSASQAALNEFVIYLQLRRKVFGASVLAYVYSDWLLSQTLLGGIKADGLAGTINDLSQFELQGAWVNASWEGAIKPHMDPLKAVRAALEAIDGGLMSHTVAMKQLYGRKFSLHIKQIKRDRELAADAGIVFDNQREKDDADFAPPDDEDTKGPDEGDDKDETNE